MPFGSKTTNLPHGVTNASQASGVMGMAGTPDPSFSHLYHNDFDVYAAGDWTTTVVGTGTTALQDGDGGQLLLTNTTGGTDSISMQLKKAGFKLNAGKACFFKFRGQLSDATNTKLAVGLVATSTTPLTANDGLFIYKASGAKTFVLRSVIGGVTTDTAFPAACAAADATMFEVGFAVDTLGNVAAFFNAKTGTAIINSTVQSQGRCAAAYGLSLTTALLNLTILHTNANAAANTLAVDYITCSNER